MVEKAATAVRSNPAVRPGLPGLGGWSAINGVAGGCVGGGGGQGGNGGIGGGDVAAMPQHGALFPRN